MKKTLSLTLFLAFAGAASAATGIFGSYVEVYTTTATIYQGEDFSFTATAFDGADLGTFASTDTLIFGQAQIDTLKNNGGNVTGAELQYRVYPTIAAPSSFATQTLGWQSDATYTDIGGQLIEGVGDQAWGNTGDIDLMALTSGAGDYTVEIFFKAFTNEGDRFSSNGGNNFKATFTAVPEPSSTALLGLGGLALIMRRRK